MAIWYVIRILLKTVSRFDLLLDYPTVNIAASLLNKIGFILCPGLQWAFAPKNFTTVHILIEAREAWVSLGMRFTRRNFESYDLYLFPNVVHSIMLFKNNHSVFRPNHLSARKKEQKLNLWSKLQQRTPSPGDFFLSMIIDTRGHRYFPYRCGI